MISTGGALGLKPWEVLRLTPRELGAMVRGFNAAHGEEEPFDATMIDPAEALKRIQARKKGA